MVRSRCRRAVIFSMRRSSRKRRPGSSLPTTDKSVTFFCFGVIALFMVLPIVLSLIQARLEGRKDRRR